MKIDFQVQEITRTKYSQALHGEVIAVVMYPLDGEPGATDGSVRLEFQDLELARKIDLGAKFALELSD